MLGTSHSWAVTMRNLLASFDKMGHELYLNSINGYELFPKAWQNKRRNADSADIDISYTLPRNFKSRFKDSSRLKLGIYNYETSILPAEWKDCIRHIDYALPSSNFSKEVFVTAGWPEDKCVVIPHGITPEDFLSKKRLRLGNDKRFRFLNVSIPHYRKNIDILLDAYYSAFTSYDDVCLVLKTSLKAPKNYFESNVKRQINLVQRKHKGRKDLPQVEIIEKRLDSMVPLYNSCNCLVSSSSSEGFGLPMLEALAADMIVISPNFSGQLDFLNKENSLLVDFDVINADRKYQYWKPSPGALTSIPKKQSLMEAMLSAYNNEVALKAKFDHERSVSVRKFTWENAAKKILDLT